MGAPGELHDPKAEEVESLRDPAAWNPPGMPAKDVKVRRGPRRAQEQLG